MPKTLTEEEQSDRAVKKHTIAAASAVRATIAEHTDGKPAHVVKAVRANARALIEKIKA